MTRIRSTTAVCPLGRLFMAGTERGLCALGLGDADDALAQALLPDVARQFPQAVVTCDGAALAPWVEVVLRYLAGTQQDLDVPLDVAGTPFQRDVWEALRAIPYGTVRPYSAIARDLRRPEATRAVARACATNPVSLVIPCHRAVGKDGSLTGYRWGIERKRALLAREREVARVGRPAQPVQLALGVG